MSSDSRRRKAPARPAKGGAAAPLAAKGTKPAQGDLMPRRRSTPGKLTPEVLERICGRIADGETRVAACAAEGVSDTALYLLRKAHPEVDEQVSIAEGLGVRWYRRQVATCEAGKDAGDDWKRWAWLAERIHPSAFRPPPQKSEQELSGPGGGSVEVETRVTIARDEALAIARRKDGER